MQQDVAQNLTLSMSSKSAKKPLQQNVIIITHLSEGCLTYFHEFLQTQHVSFVYFLHFHLNLDLLHSYHLTNHLLGGVSSFIKQVDYGTRFLSKQKKPQKILRLNANCGPRRYSSQAQKLTIVITYICKEQLKDICLYVIKINK